VSHALGGGCLPDRVFGPLGMTGQLVRELRGALAAAQGGLHHGQRVAQVAYRASGFVEVPGAEECKKGEGRACTQARPQLEAPVARCRRALVVVNCARTRPRARAAGGLGEISRLRQTYVFPAVLSIAQAAHRAPPWC
jgi:hypothetical protein